MTVCRLPSSSSQWRQTGLSQSNSRCVSQVATLTIGGPLPCRAYARRAPSEAMQKRICCRTMSDVTARVDPVGSGQPPDAHGARVRTRLHVGAEHEFGVEVT